jgi:ketosteroid isomerase-like protein
MSQQDVDQVKENVKRWNALIAEDDLEGLRALVAELYDPEVEVDWSATSPDVGAAQGIEAIVDWVMAIKRSVQELQFEVLNVIEVRDATVVYMRANARSGGAGVSMEYAYVNRFEGDKIVASTTYQTLPEALEAAWGGE